MFALALFASALLILASWELVRRFGLRGEKPDAPILVDVAMLVKDRIVLNVCMAVCLLLESATLVWDNVDPHHFPLWVRWPLDVLVVIGVAISGAKVFRLYLAAGKSARKN
jgi:hypothetical protein